MVEKIEHIYGKKPRKGVVNLLFVLIVPLTVCLIVSEAQEGLDVLSEHKVEVDKSLLVRLAAEKFLRNGSVVVLVGEKGYYSADFSIEYRRNRNADRLALAFTKNVSVVYFLHSDDGSDNVADSRIA